MSLTRVPALILPSSEVFLTFSACSPLYKSRNMVTDGALADVVAEKTIEEVDAKAQEAVAMTLQNHTAHPFHHGH